MQRAGGRDLSKVQCGGVWRLKEGEGGEGHLKDGTWSGEKQQDQEGFALV